MRRRPSGSRPSSESAHPPACDRPEAERGSTASPVAHAIGLPGAGDRRSPHGVTRRRDVRRIGGFGDVPAPGTDREQALSEEGPCSSNDIARTRFETELSVADEERIRADERRRVLAEIGRRRRRSRRIDWRTAPPPFGAARVRRSAATPTRREPAPTIPRGTSPTIGGSATDRDDRLARPTAPPRWRPSATAEAAGDRTAPRHGGDGHRAGVLARADPDRTRRRVRARARHRRRHPHRTRSHRSRSPSSPSSAGTTPPCSGCSRSAPGP